MPQPSLWHARRRVIAALPLIAALSLVAQPVCAAGDPQADVDAAKRALQGAKSQAGIEDQALAGARAQLAAVTAQLAALQAKIKALDTTISDDTAGLVTLQARLSADRSRLAAYLRQSYEQGGSEAALIYIIEAKDIPTAIQRKVQLDDVATAAQSLVARINGEARDARQTLDRDNQAQAQLRVAQEQAQTTRALVAVQEQQVAVADATAHRSVQAAQAQLTQAVAALAAARAAGTVFPPVPGPVFTVDTDLTLPSGETAARINGFLQGTAMAGLGASFMQAEHAYHVSARYFVAHAILESDWGTSAIAHDKHNLFGFGADDRNPYADAATFPSFDACIQYVAHYIEVNYLTPGGRYYHGPTLRGMNVDYASDPNWAEKIATIARTIP